MQKVKIEDEKGFKWFFSDRAFEPAEKQARDFLKRNKEQNYKLFYKNTSNFGDLWILQKR